MYLAMPECHKPFLGHCDLDLWPSFQELLCPELIFYIIWCRNPNFGVVIPLGMAEWCLPFWVTLTFTLTSGLISRFLYPATKVWRGIMLYPSVSVRPSVRPSVRAHHFRSITWVFIHGIFSNFAYILLSAMSGMGLLMGKIRPFLTELLPFFVLEKWFLACYSFTIHDIWMKLHRYVAHQRLHIVTKDRHSDLPSLWVIRPW